MTSRIDGNQGAPLSTQVDRAEAAKSTERAQNQAKAAKADRVEVSSDAALMHSAVQAANDAPPCVPTRSKLRRKRSPTVRLVRTPESWPTRSSTT